MTNSVLPGVWLWFFLPGITQSAAQLYSWIPSRPWFLLFDCLLMSVMCILCFRYWICSVPRSSLMIVLVHLLQICKYSWYPAPFLEHSKHLKAAFLLPVFYRIIFLFLYLILFLTPWITLCIVATPSHITLCQPSLCVCSTVLTSHPE